MKKLVVKLNKDGSNFHINNIQQEKSGSGELFMRSSVEDLEKDIQKYERVICDNQNKNYKDPSSFSENIDDFFS